jgi:hypothetical protein
MRASSAVQASGRHELSRVFTFDRLFAAAGFTVWP